MSRQSSLPCQASEETRLRSSAERELEQLRGRLSEERVAARGELERAHQTDLREAREQQEKEREEVRASMGAAFVTAGPCCRARAEAV